MSATPAHIDDVPPTTIHRWLSRIVEIRLWRLAAAHPRLLTATTVLQLAVTLSYAVQAAFLAAALSGLALAARDHDTTALPTGPLSAVCLVVVTRLALAQAHIHLATRLGETVRADLRERLVRALIVPTRLHDADERLGARRSALTEGVDGVDAYVSRYLAAALQVWILCPLAIAAIAWINLWAAVAVAGCVAVAVLAPRWWKRRLTDRGRDHWDSYEQLSADHLESLRVMSTLRVLGAVGRRRQRLQERSDALHRHTVATMRISLIDTGLTDIGIQVGLTAAAALAALEATGALTVPTLGVLPGAWGSGATATYLVLLLSSEAFRPVRDLARHWHAGYLGLTALDSIDAALAGGTSTSDSLASAAHPPTTRSTAQSATWQDAPELTLTDVRFGYDADDLVLDGIDLTVRPGGLVALTGASGSGKSTLFDLVLGLLHPQQGTIARPERVAVVSQHSYLFPGTVAETLRVAAPTASEDDLWHALTDVGLADTVRGWPHGVHTVLGEGGTGVSGGQRQRLAIARALLARADLLLLDEPTSALDDANARRICDVLRREAQHRIVMMIAHRPEAVAAADRRLHLQGGRLCPEIIPHPQETP
ncbi:putative ABC transporter ATP-binding/permease protein [Austwickia sp. TVS 96-490-7B]|uniref:ATP-binding cassette domain-containing protein n=1 Tax=Austwickia sp. TVS 96-490-7B TaxID=2830843 RepID=UPI001C56B146|nr:ATP-binding cassette domain-containing protein [Austwickia sp. TVS 96-490-7B]MBW3085511.1 putative ABC transporter ATP-binding/permease protein [Austwickia sp. TVS 96-490-7B]